MKLVSVAVKNFRCFRDEAHLSIDSLTTIVGKNDIGKSTLLEAMEIFFNHSLVKIDSDDANIYAPDKLVSITCEFADLPQVLSLDAGAETTLAAEYLLSPSGTLKIRKDYDITSKTVSTEVFIIAQHPTANGVSNLLELKEKDLQKLVQQRDLNVPLKGNPGMRKALWEAETDLMLKEDVAIPISKQKDDSKQFWDQIEEHLPLFALFQSDRSSRDTDGEVQNPMKAAVTTAIAEVKDEISAIQIKVKQRVEEIAQLTHDALKTINAELASELTPKFSNPTPAKWAGLFSVNMDTDDGIPLNKRGSGVRRLVLVSFFKAAAERKVSKSRRGIIYAIEEPETAQHPNNQRLLQASFKSLSLEDGYQVILTTHSPGFAAEMPADSIRYLSRDNEGLPTIESGVDVFGKVAGDLGLVPDSRVKILVCVEGPTDIVALKALSKALSLREPTLPDLSSDVRVAFVPLGGSTLKHWVSGHYLRDLGRPEVHIYDGDVTKYSEEVERVNSRNDGSWAKQMKKHEIESYLHQDAIYKAFGVDVKVADVLNDEGNAVPRAFAIAYSKHKNHDGVMSDTKAKQYLAERAFPQMTAQLLLERDPEGEIRSWIERIGKMLE